jgi:hypothetical protein
MTGANLISNSHFDTSVGWTLEGLAAVEATGGIDDSGCAVIGRSLSDVVSQFNVPTFELTRYIFEFKAKGITGTPFKAGVVGMNTGFVYSVPLVISEDNVFNGYQMSFTAKDTLLEVRFSSLVLSEIKIDDVTLCSITTSFITGTPVTAKVISTDEIIDTTIDKLVGGVHAVYCPSGSMYVDLINNIVTDPETNTINPSRGDIPDVQIMIQSGISVNKHIRSSGDEFTNDPNYQYTLITSTGCDIMIDGKSITTYHIDQWASFIVQYNVCYLLTALDGEGNVILVSP